MESPPPGWHPDHSDPNMLRYWNGEAWTEHVVPMHPNTPALIPPPPYPPGPVATPMIYQGHAGPPGYRVVPKNAAIPLIVSFFIPGVGSMMNGDAAVGVFILLGFIVCLVLSFLIVPILGVLGLWVFGMVHAFKGAQRWNQAHGFVT